MNGRVGVCVVLEDRLDIVADRYFLLGVAEQVADHADLVGVRQLDDDDHVGDRLGERGVHGVPDPLPGEDPPASLHLPPLEVVREAAVADPLRPPLMLLAGGAVLHPQLAALRALDERLVEVVVTRRGEGDELREVCAARLDLGLGRVRHRLCVLPIQREAGLRRGSSTVAVPGVVTPSRVFSIQISRCTTPVPGSSPSALPLTRPLTDITSPGVFMRRIWKPNVLSQPSGPIQSVSIRPRQPRVNPGVEEDRLVSALAGELEVVVDLVEVLRAADLLRHLRPAEREREALEVLAGRHVVPVALRARLAAHAPPSSSSPANSSGRRWATIVFLPIARTSPSWLNIVVFVAIQIDFGSSRVGFW